MTPTGLEPDTGPPRPPETSDERLRFTPLFDDGSWGDSTGLRWPVGGHRWVTRSTMTYT